MINRALNQYKSVDLNTAVEGASPHQLIQMLFRGVMEALAKAAGAIERQDIQLRVQQINKATDIIVHLKGSLDFEKGGDVAGNLDNLYDYMIRTLMQANRENDIAKLNEISHLVMTIAEGWSEMPEEAKNSKSS